MRTLVVLVALVAVVFAEHFSYEGYKVYRVQPSSEKDVEVLATISKSDQVDFWSTLRFSGKPIDVMVSPAAQTVFKGLLTSSNIQFEILIENVETVVQEERIQQETAPRATKDRISFTKYNTNNEITIYLHDLAYYNSNIVSLELLGRSYEGRHLNVIKISTDPSANKPIIFIDAGIHAREWAAPAQATYIINQLVENPANAHLLDKVDWHILPVVNPDGYEYTHKVQRFWRKTRSLGRSCYGTDANRNFGFHWGETGASSNECSDVYMGPEAFSESESQAIREHITKYKNNIKLYLTFHSYGEYLLFPWGYTSDLPYDYVELQTLGESVANSIRQVNGTVYTVGTSTNVLYAAAGGSDDWVKGVAGVELSYTIELRGGGNRGFDPPPSDILPIVTETWAGIKTYHHYIETKFGRNIA